MIGGDVDAEEREDPRAVQRRQDRQQRRVILGGRDLAQQRRDRLQPRRLDRVRVHARREVVAEQAVGGLQQLAQDDLVAPADLLE